METAMTATAAALSDDGQLWDRPRTVRLIDLWSHCPVLYDSTCPDYRDKQRRSAALSAIARELGVKDSEIRDKMRNLRSQYSREKTHETKSMVSPSMASPFVYKSRWYYFNRLSFLDESRRSAGSDSEASCGQLGLTAISDTDGTFHVQVHSHESTDDRFCDGMSFAVSTGSPVRSADPAGARLSSSSPVNGLAEQDSLSRSEESDYGATPAACDTLPPPPQNVYCEAPRLSPEEDLSVAPRLSVNVPVVARHTGARKRKMNSRRPVRRNVSASANSCHLPCSPPEHYLGSPSRAAVDKQFEEEEEEEVIDDEVHHQLGSSTIADWGDRSTSLTMPPTKFWRAIKEEDQPDHRTAADRGDDDDSEELFGRFIASELRRVADLRTKAVAKLRMHEALFAATSRHWEEHDLPISLPVTGSSVPARQSM